MRTILILEIINLIVFGQAIFFLWLRIRERKISVDGARKAGCV
jgi:hypothetical protein